MAALALTSFEGISMVKIILTIVINLIILPFRVIFGVMEDTH